MMGLVSVRFAYECRLAHAPNEEGNLLGTQQQLVGRWIFHLASTWRRAYLLAESLKDHSLARARDL